MPDFTRKGAHQFWYDYPDKSIYRAIVFMEGVEGWTADGDPQLEAALIKLGTELDGLGNFSLAMEDDFINLSSHLTTARILRILQTLDAAHPGAASKILIHAEETSENQNDTPGFFLRRNIVFERLRLLGRVFAKERFDLILKALEGDD